MRVSQINNTTNNCNFNGMLIFAERKWNPKFLKEFKENSEIKKLTELFEKEGTDIDAHYSKYIDYPRDCAMIFDMNEVSLNGNNLICKITDLKNFSAIDTYNKYMGIAK